jgi:hypothetical protein
MTTELTLRQRCAQLYVANATTDQIYILTGEDNRSTMSPADLVGMIDRRKENIHGVEEDTSINPRIFAESDGSIRFLMHEQEGGAHPGLTALEEALPPSLVLKRDRLTFRVWFLLQPVSAAAEDVIEVMHQIGMDNEGTAPFPDGADRWEFVSGDLRPVSWSAVCLHLEDAPPAPEMTPQERVFDILDEYHAKDFAGCIRAIRDLDEIEWEPAIQHLKTLCPDRNLAAIREAVAASAATFRSTDGLTSLEDITKWIDSHPKQIDREARETVFAVISTLDDGIERKAAMKAAKKRFSIDLSLIRDAVDKLRKKASNAGGLKQEDNSTRWLYEYEGKLDDPEATAKVAEVISKLNSPNGVKTPNITWSTEIESVMELSFSEDGRAKFSALPSSTFGAMLNNRMSFVKVTDGVPDPRQDPDGGAVKTFYLDTARRRLPKTPEILRVPMHMKNGELLQAKGFNEAHGVYMDIGNLKIDPIPKEPSNFLARPSDDGSGEVQGEVQDALALLDDGLVDFDFRDRIASGEDSRAPGRAGTLGLLLSPFLRRLYVGQSPLFFVTKPVPGIGGTLLGMLPSMIIDGEHAARIDYHSNDEENGKTLIAACLDGRAVLFYDDVRNFNSRYIIGALTYGKLSGRVLGVSQTVTLPNNFLWIATGNNPRLGTEMLRRSFMLRLAAPDEHIDKRTFTVRHNAEGEVISFEAWIIQQRPEIIRALLILIQNWVAQGRPKFDGPTMTSFEAWAAVVGGVLQAAGVEGFLEQRTAAAPADLEEAANEDFVQAWFTKYGEGAVEQADLFEWAEAVDLDVLGGHDDREAKKLFFGTLMNIEGRHFEVLTKDAKEEADRVYGRYEVRRDGSKWSLRPRVPKKEGGGGTPS